jgi:hypothetical protein
VQAAWPPGNAAVRLWRGLLVGCAVLAHDGFCSFAT